MSEPNFNEFFDQVAKRDKGDPSWRDQLKTEYCSSCRCSTCEDQRKRKRMMMIVAGGNAAT